MAYNFKSIAEVDMISGETENINLIVESDATVKRVPLTSVVVNTNNLDVVFVSSEFETGEIDHWNRTWTVLNPENLDKIVEALDNHGYVKAGYYELQEVWDDSRGDYYAVPVLKYFDGITNTTEMSGYKRLVFGSKIIWSEFGVSNYQDNYGE